MAFTIKPTRNNIQWIKRRTEKDARKLESEGVARWAAEGGSVMDERKAVSRKIVSVYRKHKQHQLRY